VFERYTEKARRVIFFARYEASQFGTPAIEAEHILLGIMREDRYLVNRLFSPTLASIETIRKEIERRTIVGEKISTSVDLPLSEEAKRVLAYAAEESERLERRHIGTEHLLLGILRVEESVAADILHESGLNINTIREQLENTENFTKQSFEPGSTETLPSMIAEMRGLANRMLNLCDRIETKYNELSSTKRTDVSKEEAGDNE
jgi:ATP-dependent Clp protease ATP-binding subunit ClpC